MGSVCLLIHPQAPADPSEGTARTIFWHPLSNFVAVATVYYGRQFRFQESTTQRLGFVGLSLGFQAPL